MTALQCIRLWSRSSGGLYVAHMCAGGCCDHSPDLQGDTIQAANARLFIRNRLAAVAHLPNFVSGKCEQAGGS